MILPMSAEDVSIAIRLIAGNACSFGIRGGGHGSFALSNSVDEGVTIDFGWSLQETDCLVSAMLRLYRNDEYHNLQQHDQHSLNPTWQ